MKNLHQGTEYPYSYHWRLADADFKKNLGKVFSCFACGGGSTMGYKLAGFDVIGFNEIDPKMASMYIKNHSPKFQFVEPIQEFVKWNEYPDELYNLDILDGSPPCSSFSMSGNRENDWGKKKVFREGQSEQVLDTLFFDFIELAGKLRPKVVVAENVAGILFGNAINYAKRIVSDFYKAGYRVKEYILRGDKMGIPQRRERVFFIAVRDDLAKLLPAEKGLLFSEFPELNLDFQLPCIPFSVIRDDSINDAAWTDQDEYVWKYRRKGDRNYSEVLLRIEGRDSNFNSAFIYDHKPISTIASAAGSKLTLFGYPRRMNSIEMIMAQSFPLDYDFQTQNTADIQYVLGMSVPPVMTANIASRLHSAWRPIFGEI